MYTMQDLGLMPKSEEVMEYVCTENNKEVEEHHIK
jgi:hypothetical protein